jgi:hypothetical protein
MNSILNVRMASGGHLTSYVHMCRGQLKYDDTRSNKISSFDEMDVSF